MFRQWVGKLKRFLACAFYPERVEEQVARREGECRMCGACCRLGVKCPYLMEGMCIIYEIRPAQCRAFPFLESDRRDVSEQCGFRVGEGDRGARRDLWRLLGISPLGRREVIAATVTMCAAVGVLGLLGYWWWIAAAVAAWGGFVLFFRDPERVVPRNEGLFLAPADGVVKDVEDVDERSFIGGRAVRIGIALSVFNVHVNRAPCEGVVEVIRYSPGKFHNAFCKKAAEENESNTIGIRTREGERIMVKQIAGVLARRIVCTCRLGQRLAAGERIGMIKFGSRTELYIPSTMKAVLSVKVGDRVRGGLTVVARVEEGS